MHRPSGCSQAILVKPEASITPSSEVVALAEVFRHHHTGWGWRSGTTPPPFISQQQIHPHFSRNLTTHLSTFLSCQFFFLVRLKAKFSTSVVLNISSSKTGPCFILFYWRLGTSQAGEKKKLKMQHVRQIKNNDNNNFIFPLSSCRWCTPQLIIVLLIRLVPLHISATSQSSSGTSVPNSTKQEAH